MENNNLNRRKFLKSAASIGFGACVFPAIIPAGALGMNGDVAPSNKIIMGCAGMGGMGSANTNNFLGFNDVQVVAVCDVDKNHLESGKNLVKRKYGKECDGYHDYRDMIARKDIDAVMFALPDHWHAVAAIDAAKAGKDLYSEKPISHTFNEGIAICDAIKRYDRIWQTGSWQRSQSNFRIGAELVRNNRIGKVHTTEVGLPSGPDKNRTAPEEFIIQKPPAQLDYDRWLGPALDSPYCPARVHNNWRWNYDYGGGQMLDWIGHHGDIAHWGLGFEHTGPVEVEGVGSFPASGEIWNTATEYRIVAKYANGMNMIIADTTHIPMGTKWIGDRGWIFVDRGGVLRASDPEILKQTVGPDEIKLYKSTDHPRNFIDCVRTRQQTIAPCDIAHRSTTPGHLGLIAMKLGRKIKFNPETQKIINDSTASSMLGYTMRAPWSI
ncbi:MAG: Gfo/Idh/MocA family oxidoreductase [Phycisphaerae bacterium]|nr:Gfo/Idh/MocA family oxidoreductase [Phycisphaerae bacterium]